MDFREQMYRNYINSILSKYGNLNFVSRIQNPYVYPQMDLGNGQVGTHLMQYAHNDDGYLVYPSIIQDNEGKLQKLDNEDAYQHAMSTGEYIPFDTEANASWFAQNYKKVWE
jgi:hypothetical protein